MDILLGSQSLMGGGLTGTVNIVGCIVVSDTNSNLSDSLSASSATNGIGWYNVTKYYPYTSNGCRSIVSGNLYFDGTYFNGCLVGLSYGDLHHVTVHNNKCYFSNYSNTLAWKDILSEVTFHTVSS